MEVLKESKTHPNCYYLGDFHGTIQYKKNLEVITNLVLPDNINNNINEWRLDNHSYENLQRLTPITPEGNKNWKLLLVIKKENGNIIHLKGALLNKDTNEIGLLTSINNINYFINNNHRSICSKDPDWFIGHFRMLAPLYFWKELLNRLKY